MEDSKRDESSERLESQTSGWFRKPSSSQYPQKPDVPDFELIRFLGRGGFGEVWLARSLTGIYRAVKIVERTQKAKTEIEGIRSYQVQGSDHPHLITVLHVGQTETHYFYVLELADPQSAVRVLDPELYRAKTLRSEIDREGCLPIPTSIGIACDLLSAIGHLHGVGLLHRDVKPANVLYVNGRIQLADIGLVTWIDQAADAAGTPKYAPAGGVLDRSGDIFSIGRVLLETTGGRLDRHLDSDFAREQGLDPGVVRELDQIIRRACHSNPADRFQSARDMKRALDGILPGTSLDLEPVTGSSPASRTSDSQITEISEPISARFEPTASNASFDVFIKPSSEDRRTFRVTGQTVPIHTGQLVKVRAIFDEPRHCYPLWIDSAGTVSMLGNPGAAPTSELELPPQNAWWELHPPAGTECVILLAGRVCRNPQELLERIQRVQDRPRIGSRMVLRLREGKLFQEVRPPERGPDFERTVHAESSAEPGFLQRLSHEFSGEFDIVEAIAFPLVEEHE